MSNQRQTKTQFVPYNHPFKEETKKQQNQNNNLNSQKSPNQFSNQNNQEVYPQKIKVISEENLNTPIEIINKKEQLFSLYSHIQKEINLKLQLLKREIEANHQINFLLNKNLNNSPIGQLTTFAKRKYNDYCDNLLFKLTNPFTVILENKLMGVNTLQDLNILEQNFQKMSGQFTSNYELLTKEYRYKCFKLQHFLEKKTKEIDNLDFIGNYREKLRQNDYSRPQQQNAKELNYFDRKILQLLKDNGIPQYEMFTTTTKITSSFQKRYNIDMAEELKQLCKDQLLASRNIDYFLCYEMEKLKMKRKQAGVHLFNSGFHQIYQPYLINGGKDLLNYENMQSQIQSIKFKNQKNKLTEQFKLILIIVFKPLLSQQIQRSSTGCLRFISRAKFIIWIATRHSDRNLNNLYQLALKSFYKMIITNQKVRMNPISELKKIPEQAAFNRRIRKKSVNQFISVDCGVFSCYNVMKIAEKQPNQNIAEALNFNDAEIYIFRKRLYYLTIYLELSKKTKQYNQMVLDYIDGTGIGLQQLKSELF